MIDLRQGDCLELMKDIPNKTIDMILCDLPYGTTACKWDIVIPFDKLWKQYNRIIKDNGAIVLFGSEPFSSKLRTSNIKYYKYDWVWEKNKCSNFLVLKKQPQKNYENICVFYKKAPTYNPQMRAGKPYKDNGRKNVKNLQQKLNIKSINPISNNGTRYPKAIIYYPVENTKTKLHPTQKPVELLEYLIKTYTNEGETVLDNCMGSGSTGVACINTNRNFIGIELDENYYRIACERINNTKEKVS